MYNRRELYADMVELADTPDLGSGGFGRGGSSPSIRRQRGFME
jgi:hypothetical protein